MEEEEDADLQEAIRRSMDDYHAMHAVRAAPAYTLWSAETTIGGSSSISSPSVQLRQQHQREGLHMPSSQQPQQQYRYQTYMPPVHSQQQVISSSSSLTQGAGETTCSSRDAVALGEGGGKGGAHSSSPLFATVVTSSPLPATAVDSSPPPPSQVHHHVPNSPAYSPLHPPLLRSEPVSSSPFACRSVAVATTSPGTTPFGFRSSGTGSGRSALAQSAIISALRENRGNSPVIAPASGGAEILAATTTGRLATTLLPAQNASGGREQEARGALYSPSPLAPTERLSPASLNWLCDPDELFSSRQHQQQQQRLSSLAIIQHQQQDCHQHHHPSLRLQQTQQHSSPSYTLSPLKSTTTTSPLSLQPPFLAVHRTQEGGLQPSPQLVVAPTAAQPHCGQQPQAHMSSETYLQLARQQQQLEEHLQQQQRGRRRGAEHEEGRYASVGSAATGGCEEEENIAIQQAIQESLFTCPPLSSVRQFETTASKDAAGARATNGGDAKKEEARGEDEQLQQQYCLHSPSSSRLLSLPTTAALSSARGYIEDISELLLPPPQESQSKDEYGQQQQEKIAVMHQQQQVLQQHIHQPIQQQKGEDEEIRNTIDVSAASRAAGQKVSRGLKAPADRCKTPLCWLREEEEAEEGASTRENASSSFSPSSLSSYFFPDSKNVRASPDAAGENESDARRETAKTPQGRQQYSVATDCSSNTNGERNNSKINKTRKNEEDMRKLLLSQMQPLPVAPDVKELLDVVFGEEGVNREIDPGDFSRWFHHPFLFAGDVSSRSLSGKGRAATAAHCSADSFTEEDAAECKWLINSSAKWKQNAGWCSWGLVQLHGGPCGLLAAVQCFLLRALLFSTGRVKRYTRLLMLQRRQRQSKKQQQTQQQQQQHETPQQQQQQTSQQQPPWEQESSTQSGNKQEEELNSVQGGEGEEQQDVVASSYPESGPNIHQRIREGESSAKASKYTGQEGGELNVELLSLLPSALTRRHALVEAVAAVIYQSTPASLYTVAYVLPESNYVGTNSGERKCSSGMHVTGAEKEGEETGGSEAKDLRGDLNETGSSWKSERRWQEIQEGAGGHENVSEMLEGVRVYVRRFTRIEEVMHFYNLFYDVLLARETGVISFLFSVLLTRGIRKVVNDMDMPGHSLIGVYGHCSQDLVNLLLLGAASSNVFDGDRKFGSSTTICTTAHQKEKEESGIVGQDGRREGGTSTDVSEQEKEKQFTADGQNEEKQMEQEEQQTHLKGVRKRPLAGFLSEMEALRYCEVGSRYKHPHFPLWVVGSSNHYATLFSRDLLAAAVPSARLAEIEAQAAFRDFDRDGNFLILTEHLDALLAQLGQQERLIEAQRETCAAEGVVLLSDFLKWYSKVVMQQRSESGEDVEPPKIFTLYIYDGQTPPGPSLRRFLVEASSSNSSNTKEDLEAGEMRRLLSTRWPAAAVSELPLLPLRLSTNA